MKKIYKKPLFEVVKFNYADIVAASGETEIPIFEETPEAEVSWFSETEATLFNEDTSDLTTSEDIEEEVVETEIIE